MIEVRTLKIGNVKITVEEELLAADEPAVEAPGTIVTWQRAQELVDAGFPVEWDVAGWVRIPDGGKPRVHQSIPYRIPLPEPAAQPEPVAEMNAEQAREYIRNTGNPVRGKNGAIWTLDDASIRNDHPGDLFAPYTPLGPLTQSQVAPQAEVERLEGKVQDLLRAIGERGAHVMSLEQQLRDVTEERDRALHRVSLLRHALYEIKAGVNCVDAALDATNESAGKGQG